MPIQPFDVPAPRSPFHADASRTNRHAPRVPCARLNPTPGTPAPSRDETGRILDSRPENETEARQERPARGFRVGWRYPRVVSLLDGRRASLPIHEIRPRARAVAEQAQHVGVVRERAERLADAFALPVGLGGLGQPLDGELRFHGDASAELAFCVILAAVRFGSGYHAQLRKLPGLSVGQTMVRALAEEFERHGPPVASELRRVVAEDCARWFAQDPGEPAHLELMDLFARSLRELGRVVADEHAGRFEGLVRMADGSAAALVERVAGMPFFADVQRYRGLEMPFYLRAQHLVIDLVQSFGGQGFGAFSDLDLLAPSGDHVVAHVLRMDGVLRYDRGLAERIDRGEPVPAHTEREIEIRAAAVHAVDLVASTLRARGVGATDAQVDTWLRERGRAPQYRTKPRHRSRTVLY